MIITYLLQMAGRGLAKQKINWKKKFRTIQPQDSSRENLVDVSFFFNPLRKKPKTARPEMYA